MCSTLDSSFCGTQSSIFHYDDNGNDSKYYFFTYDNGVKVGLRRYVYINLDMCKASITDADGTITPCECNFKNCPDVISLKPYVTCGDYESGAFADACMDEAWGVQGGVMLAFSINAGLCVAADNSTVPPPPPPATTPTGGGSPTSDTAPVAAPVANSNVPAVGVAATTSNGDVLSKSIAVVAVSFVIGVVVVVVL
jgi:hypothetical protein